ncbi:hypothetical protein PV11_08933 [Exophiala sideris]|uniref:AB hydrolase-1 domain-containing protein n=1 Tax=Exophiala sideris TaxID=1016849 RepID=A0A0D1WPU2_9EURO|nr:hypothetical protein PV11_08933 [Exophiala sideris]
MNDAARDAAIETLCDARLHQSLILPASALPDTNIKTPLRITYSDIGHSPPHSPQHDPPTDGIAEAEPNSNREPCVVLFIGGLMGGRYTLCRIANIARRSKVRIITIDRPGMGGSTPVHLEHRLAVHLATIPALLSHLHIKHVTLASHSGGAPYLLQTLLMHRNLLHPMGPHVVMLAPFIPPDDSGAPLMRLTASLPSGLISRFHSAATLVNRTITLSAGISLPFSQAGAMPTVTNAIDAEEGDDETEKAVLKNMEKLSMQYVFAENISGSSDDALLYLRKKTSSNGTVPEGQPTEEWLDWASLAGKVAAVERERRPHMDPDERSSALHSGTVKLKVDAFHAEKDIMSGTKGAKYFDACWERHSADMDYVSKVTEGTNHDSILDPSLGVVDIWLQGVAERWYGSTKKT